MKYIFHVKILICVTAKSDQNQGPHSGKNWIRIRTDTNADPQHWSNEAIKNSPCLRIKHVPCSGSARGVGGCLMPAPQATKGVTVSSSIPVPWEPQSVIPWSLVYTYTVRPSPR